MPGFELIGNKELNNIKEIFKKSNGVLFAHGFEKLRKNIFRVRKFENEISKFFGSKYVQCVSSGTAAIKIALKSAGVKYNDEIHAVMCFAFTNKIPKTVKELDLMSKDAFLQSATRDQKIGKIAIAYTVWSTKRGGGKLIVKQVFKMIKKSNHLNRLVTLSPMTEMARNFHLKNGAEEIQVNEETQNFEYKIIK